MGPLAETVDAIVRLRSLGAVRVSIGDVHAVFAAGDAHAHAHVDEGKLARVSLTQSEQDELSELRAMKRRADELGWEV